MTSYNSWHDTKTSLLRLHLYKDILINCKLRLFFILCSEAEFGVSYSSKSGDYEHYVFGWIIPHILAYVDIIFYFKSSIGWNIIREKSCCNATLLLLSKTIVVWYFLATHKLDFIGKYAFYNYFNK